MTAVPFPRKRGFWERLIALISNDTYNPYARPVPGYQGAGFAQPGQVSTVDGFRVGDVKYAFGTQDSVLRDNPGWAIADGTATVTIDGVGYSPNLTGAFIIGADGSTFAPGGTGGTAAHVHPFTHESAHVITQPVFDGPTGHSTLAAHTVTQPTFRAPTAHGAHPVVNLEVAASLGSGIWAPTQVSSAALTAAMGHANETGGFHQPDPLTETVNVALNHNHDALDHNHDAPNRSTDVALTNNAPHSGGAVLAATGANKYPPYVAVWPLLKVS